MFTDPAPADETRFLRISDILKRFPISRPTIYRLIQKGEFPKPARFGNSSVWPEHEIIAWQQKRLAER